MSDSEAPEEIPDPQNESTEQESFTDQDDDSLSKLFSIDYALLFPLKVSLVSINPSESQSSLNPRDDSRHILPGQEYDGSGKEICSSQITFETCPEPAETKTKHWDKNVTDPLLDMVVIKRRNEHHGQNGTTTNDNSDCGSHTRKRHLLRRRSSSLPDIDRSCTLRATATLSSALSTDLDAQHLLPCSYDTLPTSAPVAVNPDGIPSRGLYLITQANVNNRNGHLLEYKKLSGVRSLPRINRTEFPNGSCIPNNIGSQYQHIRVGSERYYDFSKRNLKGDCSGSTAGGGGSIGDMMNKLHFTCSFRSYASNSQLVSSIMPLETVTRKEEPITHSASCSDCFCETERNGYTLFDDGSLIGGSSVCLCDEEEECWANPDEDDDAELKQRHRRCAVYDLTSASNLIPEWKSFSALGSPLECEHSKESLNGVGKSCEQLVLNGEKDSTNAPPIFAHVRVDNRGKEWGNNGSSTTAEGITVLTSSGESGCSKRPGNGNFH